MASVHCTKIVTDASESIARDETTSAICNVRPPGHHAYGAGQIAGFCFINNVVVAAKNLVESTKSECLFSTGTHTTAMELKT